MNILEHEECENKSVCINVCVWLDYKYEWEKRG